MPRASAGLLLYRRTEGRIEALLVHPGGPYWSQRDDGAWSIPKGEHDDHEDPLEVVRREFREELGTEAPAGTPTPLGEIRQRGGKRVRAWALEGDLDASTVRSNTFSMEWPPHSGATREFPEVDRAAWFDLDTARRKLLSGQVAFVDRLAVIL
jgi:predicted NUDIX family NTP pyrophosphohydrolase